MHVNQSKIGELRKNCQDRARAWEQDCADRHLGFTIAEAYRTQARQYLYFTQSRTLENIESLLRAKVISQADFNALKSLYDSGKNLQGPVVTKTLRSNHTLRIAVDIDPITLPDPDDIPPQYRTIKATDSEATVKKKLTLFRLMQIEMVGRRYGVCRPGATLAFGDYRHFEIYDLPYHPPTPTVKPRLDERLKKLQTSEGSPPI